MNLKPDKTARCSQSPATRLGFTLIELLLVISIIAILSGLSLLVLRGAEKDASTSRTAAQVQRINQVLASKWEEYQTRVLRFRLDSVSGSANMNANEIQRIRSRALLDLARVEFPNSIDSLREFPSPESQVASASTSPAEKDYWPNAWVNNYLNLTTNPALLPSLLINYRREFGMTWSGVKANGVETYDNVSWSPENQDAECLYAILKAIRIDGVSGLDYVNLRSTEVGDTDGDGFLEVLDAFGDPLIFVFLDPLTEPNINLVGPDMPEQVPFVVLSRNMAGL